MYFIQLQLQALASSQFFAVPFGGTWHLVALRVSFYHRSATVLCNASNPTITEPTPTLQLGPEKLTARDFSAVEAIQSFAHIE